MADVIKYLEIVFIYLHDFYELHQHILVYLFLEILKLYNLLQTESHFFIVQTQTVLVERIQQV